MKITDFKGLMTNYDSHTLALEYHKDCLNVKYDNGFFHSQDLVDPSPYEKGILYKGKIWLEEDKHSREHIRTSKEYILIIKMFTYTWTDNIFIIDNELLPPNNIIATGIITTLNSINNEEWVKIINEEGIVRIWSASGDNKVIRRYNRFLYIDKNSVRYENKIKVTDWLKKYPFDPSWIIIDRVDANQQFLKKVVPKGNVIYYAGTGNSSNAVPPTFIKTSLTYYGVNAPLLTTHPDFLSQVSPYPQEALWDEAMLPTNFGLDHRWELYRQEIDIEEGYMMANPAGVLQFQIQKTTSYYLFTLYHLNLTSSNLGSSAGIRFVTFYLRDKTTYEIVDINTEINEISNSSIGTFQYKSESVLGPGGITKKVIVFTPGNVNNSSIEWIGSNSIAYVTIPPKHVLWKLSKLVSMTPSLPFVTSKHSSYIILITLVVDDGEYLIHKTDKTDVIYTSQNPPGMYIHVRIENTFNFDVDKVNLRFYIMLFDQNNKELTLDYELYADVDLVQPLTIKEKRGFANPLEFYLDSLSNQGIFYVQNLGYVYEANDPRIYEVYDYASSNGMGYNQYIGKIHRGVIGGGRIQNNNFYYFNSIPTVHPGYAKGVLFLGNDIGIIHEKRVELIKVDTIEDQFIYSYRGDFPYEVIDYINMGSETLFLCSHGVYYANSLQPVLLSENINNIVRERYKNMLIGYSKRKNEIYLLDLEKIKEPIITLNSIPETSLSINFEVKVTEAKYMGATLASLQQIGDEYTVPIGVPVRINVYINATLVNKILEVEVEHCDASWNVLQTTQEKIYSQWTKVYEKSISNIDTIPYFHKVKILGFIDDPITYTDHNAELKYIISEYYPTVTGSINLLANNSSIILTNTQQIFIIISKTISLPETDVHGVYYIEISQDPNIIINNYQTDFTYYTEDVIILAITPLFSQSFQTVLTLKVKKSSDDVVIFESIISIDYSKNVSIIYTEGMPLMGNVQYFTQYVLPNTTITLKQPTLVISNYVFVEWIMTVYDINNNIIEHINKSAGDTYLIPSNTKNINLIAVYQPQTIVTTYEISFDPGQQLTSGTIPSSIFLSQFGNTVLPLQGNMIVPNMKLIKWIHSITFTEYNPGSNFQLQHTQNIVFTGKWESIIPIPVSYPLSYDLNNGNGTIPLTVSYLAGTQITLYDGSAITKTGYINKGWNTQPDGSGYSYLHNQIITMPSHSLILYVEWKDDRKILTYDSNFADSGNVPIPEYYIQGDLVTVKGYGNLIKAGYIPLYWCTNSNDDPNLPGYNVYVPNDPTNNTFIITDNITLYLIWEVLPPPPPQGLGFEVSGLNKCINRDEMITLHLKVWNTLSVFNNFNTPMHNSFEYEVFPIILDVTGNVLNSHLLPVGKPNPTANENEIWISGNFNSATYSYGPTKVENINNPLTVIYSKDDPKRTSLIIHNVRTQVNNTGSYFYILIRVKFWTDPIIPGDDPRLIVSEKLLIVALCPTKYEPKIEYNYPQTCIEEGKKDSINFRIYNLSPELGTKQLDYSHYYNFGQGQGDADIFDISPLPPNNQLIQTGNYQISGIYNIINKEINIDIQFLALLDSTLEPAEIFHIVFMLKILGRSGSGRNWETIIYQAYNTVPYITYEAINYNINTIGLIIEEEEYRGNNIYQTQEILQYFPNKARKWNTVSSPIPFNTFYHTIDNLMSYIKRWRKVKFVIPARKKFLKFKYFVTFVIYQDTVPLNSTSPNVHYSYFYGDTVTDQSTQGSYLITDIISQENQDTFSIEISLNKNAIGTEKAGILNISIYDIFYYDIDIVALPEVMLIDRLPIPITICEHQLFHVIYHDNGADNYQDTPVDSLDYKLNQKAIIKSYVPLVKYGHIFKWWNTLADGTGLSLVEGDKHHMISDLHLYAIWEKEYWYDPAIKDKYKGLLYVLDLERKVWTKYIIFHNEIIKNKPRFTYENDVSIISYDSEQLLEYAKFENVTGRYSIVEFENIFNEVSKLKQLKSVNLDAEITNIPPEVIFEIKQINKKNQEIILKLNNNNYKDTRFYVPIINRIPSELIQIFIKGKFIIKNMELDLDVTKRI